MPARNYPATVAEVVDDGMKYRRGVIAACRVFKAKRPYRLPVEEQLIASRMFYRKLAEVYGVPEPVLTFNNVTPNAPRGNGVCQTTGTSRPWITLFHKFSIITLLHEFAHALGKDEQQACRWSINLFKRVFPVLYGRLRQHGHTLVTNAGREARLRQAAPNAMSVFGFRIGR